MVVSARVMFRTYSTLGRALAAVPEPVALGIAGLVGDVLHQVRREPRRNVERNLRRVVGGDIDQASLDRWSRRAFRAYARYWVEGARLPSTPRREVLQRFVVVEGFEHLVAGMAAGKGVVLALPHVGSWEYGGTFLAAVGYPMTSVAERLEPPELFDYFVSQRAAMGLTIVPLDGASGGVVMRTLRDGGLVGLLCDRDLLDNGIDVEFFGEKTTMPSGPATLAMRTGATLLTTAVYSGPGPDHHAVIGGPIDLTRTGSLRGDVSRVTQELAHRFESLIRRAPEQWHVFRPLWPADRDEAGP
ncbi:MAG: phosphatidylinositol mannoside acyltransferase [Acidimicrobiales bacterium]|jgi:lauroyl/myristoyl acyltransferase